MSSLKIITYNVRGLNSPIKRANILCELKCLKAEVAILQETHLSVSKNQKIYYRDFPVWFYGDSPIKGARGVAIGFAKEVRFELEERMADPDGRFLFLKGKINGSMCSLAKIYGPNKNTYRNVIGILARFEEFKSGRVIIAGDFNLCLDPPKDCSSCVGDRWSMGRQTQKEAVPASVGRRVEDTTWRYKRLHFLLPRACDVYET